MNPDLEPSKPLSESPAIRCTTKTAWILVLLLLLILLCFMNEPMVKHLLNNGKAIRSNDLRGGLLVLDLALIVLIYVVIRRRQNFNLNLLFIQICAVLAIWAACDLLLHISIRVLLPSRDPETLRKIVNKREMFPAHMGAEWPLKDALEKGPRFLATDYVYDQFLTWRKAEFHGTYTNIDRDGFRRTWNPQSQSHNPLDTLFFFGGSTAWGIGARDEFTIPSYISKILDSLGTPMHVVNCGELAYISNQEYLKLLLMLREGRVPKQVIFYDGFNDVSNAYRNNSAGKIKFYNNFKEELPVISNLFSSRTLESRGGKRIVKALITISSYSKINMTIGIITRRVLNLLTKHGEKNLRKYSDQELEEFAKQIKKNYLDTVRALQRISDAYDFNYLCFWQPMLLLEDKVLPEEKSAFSYYYWTEDTYRRRHYDSVNRLMHTGEASGFYNITDALKDRTEPVYLDPVHLAENGNRMIAECIVQVMQENNFFNR